MILILWRVQHTGTEATPEKQDFLFCLFCFVLLCIISVNSLKGGSISRFLYGMIKIFALKRPQRVKEGFSETSKCRHGDIYLSWMISLHLVFFLFLLHLLKIWKIGEDQWDGDTLKRLPKVRGSNTRCIFQISSKQRKIF